MKQVFIAIAQVEGLPPPPRRMVVIASDITGAYQLLQSRGWTVYSIQRIDDIWDIYIIQ